MNFCPNCGVRVQGEQSYCRNCGFDLRSRAASELPGRLAETPFAVWGLGMNTEYFMTPEGFLKVKIRSEFFVVLVGLLAVPVALLLGLFIQAASPWFYPMMWFLLAAPIYDEFKWRSLKKMEGLSVDELSSRSGSTLIPWSFIRRARLRGRNLSISSTKPYSRASVSFDESDAPVLERTLASRLGDRYSRVAPRRVPPFVSNLPVMVVVLFVASQLVLVLAAVLPFFPGEEQVYVAALNSLRQTAAPFSVAQEFRLILLNNVQVAVGTGVPGLGIFTLLASAYNTGRVLQVIAIQANIPAPLETLNLFLYPHTWLEEMCYPTAAGVTLYYLFNWNATPIHEMSDRLKRGSVRLSLSFAGVALLLTIAAIFEVSEPYLGGAALLLWFPLGVVVILFRRRLIDLGLRLTGR